MSPNFSCLIFDPLQQPEVRIATGLRWRLQAETRREGEKGFRPQTHGDFRGKDGKVKMQSEETGGEEDGYGKGRRGAELASPGSWVRPRASLQLGQITAVKGVSGSAGSASFEKAELHKAFGRSFTSCSVFQNHLFLPRRVPLPHFQTLNEAAPCQMGKLRPGGADLPNATRPTADTAALPPCRRGMRGCAMARTNSIPSPPEWPGVPHHPTLHSAH